MPALPALLLCLAAAAQADAPDADFAAALRAHEAGQVQDAERRYRRVVDADSAPAELKASAWVNLGVIAEAQGDFDQAVTFYAAALMATTARETKAKALMNLAIVKDKDHHPEEAEARYREALALDPAPASRAAILE